MKTGTASAPGKAVLAGEYAVLEGAPAISMAVNRRAAVTVVTTDNDFHTVASPGFHDRTRRFRCTESGGFDWLDEDLAPTDCELLEQIWTCVRPVPLRGLALTLDTRDLFSRTSRVKLGFGSSAALAVALTAALMQSAAATMDVYRSAARAHRNFQAGKGSGVDIATAFYGGVIGFSMRAGLICKLHWPADLQFALLSSGKPASTTEKMSQLDSFVRDRAASVSASKLRASSANVLEAWQNGGSAAIIDSLRAYTTALWQFSNDRDLGVFDAGHKELVELALECGVVYKPCGAGGGDVGAVFARERAGIADFTDRAKQYGFALLDARRDSRGAINDA